MILKSVIEDYDVINTIGNTNIDISGIEYDSRKIKEGYMFIAEKGYTVDGHDYINAAINNGAVAIVVENDVEIGGITTIKVEDSTHAMAKFSSSFYNKPWEKMNMIGVTGTNGKTSTTYFLNSILKNTQKIGIIGTNGALIDDEIINIENTTPKSLTIHSILNEMVESSIDTCIMEVSSHALELNRVNYMEYDIGLFTNLSKDHLDYHITMEDYFDSKLKLFYKTKDYNIVNIDDIYGKKILERVGNRVPILTFGIKENADITATDIKHGLSNISFTLNTPKGSRSVLLNTPGEFSIYNALAAATTSFALDVSLDDIKTGLERLQGVKGRFEVVPTNTDYTVIIDFAHTADGLDKVLNVISEFCQSRKITVFGAGGNRDKTKRPEMGETVGRLSDLSIVTSDNPRNEEPEAIIDDIIVGTKLSGGDYVKIIERKAAIEHALDIASAGDIILLAGKGHETYTIMGNKKIDFDERQIVIDYLSNKNIQ